MKLTCECCQFKQEFKDGEEAFRAGWDAPPHFTGYICCNLCPAVALILPTKAMALAHAKQHERWKKEGRPADFIPPEVEFPDKKGE